MDYSLLIAVECFESVTLVVQRAGTEITDTTLMSNNEIDFKTEKS